MFRRLSPSVISLSLAAGAPLAPAARFIIPPDAAAIRSVRVFEDPVLPVDAAPSAAENAALAHAMEQYHTVGQTEAVEPFLAFLDQFPQSPNRITASVKGMLLEALDEVGGKEYLILQAEKNPTAFLALIAKLIPSEVKAEVAPAPALFSEDQLLRVAEEIRRKREQATA